MIASCTLLIEDIKPCIALRVDVATGKKILHITSFFNHLHNPAIRFKLGLRVGRDINCKRSFFSVEIVEAT